MTHTVSLDNLVFELPAATCASFYADDLAPPRRSASPDMTLAASSPLRNSASPTSQRRPSIVLTSSTELSSGVDMYSSNSPSSSPCPSPSPSRRHARSRSLMTDSDSSMNSSDLLLSAPPSTPTSSRRRRRRRRSGSPLSSSSETERSEFQGELQLQNSWTFWYDEQLPRGATSADYANALKSLGSFSSIQNFWRFWNNIDVSKFPPGSNLRMFKKGIKPQWEDPLNRKGGKWTVYVAFSSFFFLSFLL